MSSPCYVRYFSEMSRAQLLVGAKTLLHDHSSSIRVMIILHQFVGTLSTWKCTLILCPFWWHIFKNMYISSIKNHTKRLGYWVYILQSMEHQQMDKWVHVKLLPSCMLSRMLINTKYLGNPSVAYESPRLKILNLNLLQQIGM
jgi:hypothetical protein